MRLARGIHGPRETAAQALDGFGNGPDALLRAAHAASRVLAQELQALLPLPPRFRLHRLACPREKDFPRTAGRVCSTHALCMGDPRSEERRVGKERRALWS